MAKKKEMSRRDRNILIDELKADVDRVKNVAKIIDSARARASYMVDGELQQLLDGILDEAYDLCLKSRDAKVREVNSLTYKNIGEEIEDFEGNKGVRRLER